LALPDKAASEHSQSASVPFQHAAMHQAQGRIAGFERNVSMLVLKNVGTALVLAAGIALCSSGAAISTSAAPAAANLLNSQASTDSNLIQVRRGGRGGGRFAGMGARGRNWGGGGWRGGGRYAGNWGRGRNWGGRGWNRGYAYNRRWGYGGAFLGLGLGGALLASNLYNDNYVGYRYARPYYSYGYGGNGSARCAARFRSFEPSTGMYTTYGGQRRLCPYLG
jgi:hypothetical protein